MHWVLDFTGSRADLEHLGGDARRAVCVYSNIEARSRNHCCRVKAKGFKYYECGFVALGIRMQWAFAISSYVATPGLVLKVFASFHCYTAQ